MLRRRFYRLLLLLVCLLGLMYVLVSLYLPSSRRLVVGVNKNSGTVRTVAQTITFLPPHQFYRLSFDKRGQDAQRDGIIRINSKENVPLKLAYRVRFSLTKGRLPDSRRLVSEGWTAWLNARITEAVRAVTTQVPIEDFASPTSDFASRRSRFKNTVAQHLARSGLQVTAFEIERIEIDREALLQFKRADLRRNARGAMGRVAIFTIEGADWELLSELSDDDRIPNLKALIQRGTTASVQTIQPTVAPLLATTIATGLNPDRHGVLDFTDRNDKSAPVSSLSRRGPALWEIAPAFARSAEVVNWWTAWPPSKSGALIFDTPVQNSSNLYPAELSPRLSNAVVSESSLGYDQVRPFLNITPAEFQTAVSSADAVSPIATFRSVLAKTWSDHRVGIAGYRLSKPMLLMVSFDGADTVNHLFGPYHPPQRDDVSDDGYRKYWPAVASYYSEVDRLIGEWMKELPADTTVMIMSSHGMRWGKDRPKAPPQGGSALSVHRNPGVFIGYGNQILPSRAAHKMALIDVAPTALAILGLPAAKEMTGKIIDWAFKGLTPVTSVSVLSYGDFIDTRAVLTRSSVEAVPYRQALQQIGHLPDLNVASTPMLDEDEATEKSTVTPEQWGLYAYHNNVGISLKTQGKSKEAIQEFDKAIEINSSRPVPYLNSAMLLFEKAQYTAADEAFFSAVNRSLPNAERYFIDYAAAYREKKMTTRAVNILLKGKSIFPQSYAIAANLGSALATADRYTEAVTELERALGISPGSTLVLNNLATIYIKKKDYGRALDYWNRSLAIEPQQAAIRSAVEAVRSHL
ncbi:MAG TPA: alkaline phosphatase family protein [Thermoanaerobaculia bacterium]|nr:alkaline phosphatase family protein [Thermoanaerobaculia bacterium]